MATVCNMITEQFLIRKVAKSSSIKGPPEELTLTLSPPSPPLDLGILFLVAFDPLGWKSRTDSEVVSGISEFV